MSAIQNVTSQAVQQTAQSTQSAKSAKAEEKKTSKQGEQAAAVYEKSSSEPEKKATYTINKMSEKDRAALVQQLKADQETRQSQFLDLVNKTINGQGKAFSLANGDDSIWKFLASGDFTVDAETQAKAQEDISEDGYWGVKNTAQRLFDFASALAGDDVEKMQKMQAAMEKGFGEATKAWGKDLPDISRDTLSAANKMFEDYYASKKTEA